ncbi:MAG TPA: AarF/UbiB family protein [Phycisphaerae bacterium]|nr:AarF/UbiB family protein [Phycisphaerae bacterium]
MALSLHASHLKHYKDIAALLWKYGRSDLVKRAGLEQYGPAQASDAPDSAKAAAEASELADDLECMGPTYIKLGQLLSTRPDILPPAYMHALARLQDNVEPFPFEEAEKIITSELGVRISRAFQEIDPKPLAAASIGQVHKAILRDGRHVVMKIQRPGIRERMVEDLDVLTEIAEFLDHHTETGRRTQFTRTVEEFRKMLLRELDYREEAANLVLIAKNLANFPRIVVPQPVEDYSTARILTMEYIVGQKITALSPVVRVELDGEALAEELFQAYLQQILVDGFFHADPHPGNVFLTEDSRIALLDLGMAARLSPALQEDLLRLVLAISEGNGDDAVEFALKNGEKLEGFNEQKLRRDVADLVARQRDADLKRSQIGTVMMEIRRIAHDSCLRLPPELSLIGKTLLNLDQIGWTLAPSFNPAASIRRNAANLMQKRFWKSLSPGNLFTRALELREFVQQLPRRVNHIMDAVVNNELRMKVDAIDETYLMTGFQKIANRITLGLILAALIVGAALLMRVDTSFRIFGYPGLAIILFLLAAAGGVVMMFHILFSDEANTTKSDK